MSNNSLFGFFIRYNRLQATMWLTESPVGSEFNIETNTSDYTNKIFKF